MVGPGCPVCVSAPFQGAMQPHNADLHQRTYAREGGAPSLGPAWRHSESSPCRPDPDLPSGTVGLISSALCSRQPYLPPGWPMGEVLIRFLTDDPALGVAPLSNHVLFVLSRTSSAATCSECSHPPHTGCGRFLHRPQKMSHSIVLGAARCPLSIRV